MAQVFGVGIDELQKTLANNRYFYGLRRTEAGELYMVKSDLLRLEDGVQLNRPGNIDENYNNWSRGEWDPYTLPVIAETGGIVKKKKQGYKDRKDESIAMRIRKKRTKKQLKASRDDSYGRFGSKAKKSGKINK